ncbi:MAG: SMC-Scp complex subunit ScpB [Nitrososphaerales archaeon]
MEKMKRRIKDYTEAKANIEAALYASGRPLSLEQLVKLAGLTSKRKTLTLIREVANSINSNLKALEVRELSNQRFVLQLKPSFINIAKKVSTKPLIPKASLKTLAYIALYQPISLQTLVNKRGSQVYKHLKLLANLGFVKAELKGRSKVYSVTQSFSDYFGLSYDPEVMKKQLQNLNLRLKVSSP